MPATPSTAGPVEQAMILLLDTNVVIYVVEGNPVFAPKTVLRLAAAQSTGDSFMISDPTRIECLVGPLKTNHTAVRAGFHGFFARSNVRVVCRRLEFWRPF